MFCQCKDKVVLYQPKYAMEAIETWCPKHGYNNDCWMCPVENNGVWFSTELCIRHRSPEFRESCNKNCPDKVIGPISGPGSLTCDRAGPVTIEDCKTCWGTGGCRYGKTEQEFKELKESFDAHYQKTL